MKSAHKNDDQDQPASSVGWLKSSFCESGSCVEVALANGRVLLRDGKDSSGAVLEFNTEEWDAFLKGVKNTEFDS